MPHYGTLKDFIFQKDVDDVRGSTLYGMKGEKLGRVSDVIFEHATGDIKYVVVDTGGLFTHKEFLVPADRVHGYEKDKGAFQVDLAKERIERFPKYDAKALRSEKEWGDYETEYRRTWKEDPVLHRTDRVDLDVTPADIHAPAAIGSGVPMGSLGEEVEDRITEEELAREDQEGRFTPQRLAGKFPDPGPAAKIEMVPAGSEAGEGTVPANEYPVDANPPANPTQQKQADIGQWHPRMKAFEEVLKKNRVDVTASCASCAPGKKKVA